MTTSINIRPGVGILSLFPHMNYQPWFALAEFVDNALASYLARRDEIRSVDGANFQFRVVVEIDPNDTGEIRVWDNAGGIATADYARAFVTAEPPPDASGLSQFGIGMKSASCWFARKWSVRTKSLGETVERRVSFDVPRIVKERIDEMAVEERVAALNQHFTEVRLTDLYKPPWTRTTGKMRDHLASIYRDFLRSGEMVLEFRGEPLAFHDPPVLYAMRWDDDDGEKVMWKKDLAFTLPTGEHVQGFAALREVGSTRYAGFALFRKRRLIVGSADETYRPAEVFGGTNSYRYQRLFGELHVDGFDVTHTKDGFIWGDREADFLRVLKEHLDDEPLPLLTQAERHRSRKADASVEMAAGRAIQSTVTALGTAGELLTSQSERPDSGSLPASHVDATVVAERTLALEVHGERWLVRIEATNDPAHSDWLEIAGIRQVGHGERAERSVQIRVSLANDFMRRFAGATAEDLEPLLRIAAGLAIAEHTARAAGVLNAGTIRRNLNELLSSSLARA